MPMHPLPILLNHGIPVALGSDDPAMFQNMGLSFDFYQVSVMSVSARDDTDSASGPCCK